MPRDFFEATLGTPDAGGLFKVLTGLRVNVYQRGTTTPVNIYTTEVGATQGPAPDAAATGGPNPFFTGPTGSAQFWADLGRYDVVVDDPTAPARIAPRTIQWNAKAVDGIPSSSLADLAVTTPKLADLGVTTGKLADLVITTPKLGAAQVTSPKIEAQQAWQTMTMATSGTAVWSTALQYFKSSIGLVYCKGICAFTGAPASPQNIATFPAGYRPISNQHFAVPRVDSPAAGCIVTMADVILYAASGILQCPGSPGTWAVGTYDFSSIRFRAEQ